MKYQVILFVEKVRDWFYPVDLFYPFISIIRILTSKKRAPLSDKKSKKLFLKRRIRNGINNLDMLRRTTDCELSDKVILELGTGYHGIDLVLLYLLGVKKTYTLDASFGIYDIVFDVLPLYEEFLSDIASIFDVDEARIRQRWLTLSGEHQDVGRLLVLLNAEYIPLSDFVKKKKLDFRVDVFYSESTLQRVPKANIRQFLEAVQSILNHGAIAFHRIDTRDINVQRTKSMFDPNLWRLEYLKYSEWVWNLITTERYGSQNRLRVNEFVRLFADCGFRLVWAENYVYSGDIDRLSTFSLAKHLQSMPADDIAVSHARLVLSTATIEQSAVVRTFQVEDSGVRYPPSRWNPDLGLLEGEGLND